MKLQESQPQKKIKDFASWPLKNMMMLGVFQTKKIRAPKKEIRKSVSFMVSLTPKLHRLSLFFRNKKQDNSEVELS